MATYTVGDVCAKTGASEVDITVIVNRLIEQEGADVYPLDPIGLQVVTEIWERENRIRLDAAREVPNKEARQYGTGAIGTDYSTADLAGIIEGLQIDIDDGRIVVNKHVDIDILAELIENYPDYMPLESEEENECDAEYDVSSRWTAEEEHMIRHSNEFAKEMGTSETLGVSSKYITKRVTRELGWSVMNDPKYASLTFAEMAALPEFEQFKDVLLWAEEAWNELEDGENADWFLLV